METRVLESGRLGQPPLFTLPLPGKPPLTACFFECSARDAERLLPKLALNKLSVDRLKVSPRQWVAPPASPDSTSQQLEQVSHCTVIDLIILIRRLSIQPIQQYPTGNICGRPQATETGSASGRHAIHSNRL